jgi:methylmalonyl-CoA mutase N-terminal domain/subunit
VRQVRASRDRSAVERRLGELDRAARGADNLLPPILEAAASYATVGEISGRLRSVFGEYRENT